MSALMSGAPPLLQNQVTLRNWRTSPYNQWAFSNVRNLIPSDPIPAGQTKIILEQSTEDLSTLEIAGDTKKPQTLKEFLKSSHTDSFVILKNGKLKWSWYGNYASANSPHIVFSISKSLTALLAIALIEEKIIDTECPLSHYIPEVKGGAYENATVRNLLDMNVSSSFEENYLAKSGIFHEYRNATGWNEVLSEKRQGLRDFLSSLPGGDGRHGEVIHYCSPHTDMLGWVIERVTNQKFAGLLAKKILQPCGLAVDGYVTLDFFGAPRSAGGINICTQDLAKVGEMIRCGGDFNGVRVLKEASVADICNFDNKVSWKDKFLWADKLFPAGRYRSNWYQTQSPDNEVFGSGIHGQWLWVNPVKMITIASTASHPLPLTISGKDQIVEMFRQVSNSIS